MTSPPLLADTVRARPRFATRLLVAQALVLVAGTVGLLDKYVFQEQPQLSGYLKDTANIGYMALMYWYFLRLFRLYRAPGWTVSSG